MRVNGIRGTRSHIYVDIEDKTICITGELTLTPAFYADISSIKHWESPFENKTIDEEMKEQIIKAIIDYTKDKEVKIYFE